MSENVRQAAERLRSDMTEHDGLLLTAYTAKVADLFTVRNAYLAEHPADDDEAVTEEWLRSVGFTFGHRWKNGFRYCEFEADESTVVVSQPDGDDWRREEWTVGGERIPHGLMPDTRGEVRRLFAKLGITLTEAKGEGT